MSTSSTDGKTYEVVASVDELLATEDSVGVETATVDNVLWENKIFRSKASARERNWTNVVERVVELRDAATELLLTRTLIKITGAFDRTGSDDDVVDSDEDELVIDFDSRGVADVDLTTKFVEDDEVIVERELEEIQFIAPESQRLEKRTMRTKER